MVGTLASTWTLTMEDRFRILGPPSLAMEEEAFRVFYDRTSRPLWAYLVKAGGDRQLADDLVQESYYRFLRADFEPESSTHARRYLFRIATNLLRDHFRHASRWRQEPLAEQTAVQNSSGGRVDLESDLRVVFLELKERDRKLLWLAHVEGFSHKEIAEMLGLKAASIRLLLFRARRRLAALLEEKGLAAGVTT